MSILFHNKPLPEPYTIYIQNFNFEKYLEYAHEDIKCELIDGVLIIQSPASLEHELIFKFLLTLLELHVQGKKLGLVVGSRFTMRLSSTWAPEPDIMFITSEDEKNLKENYLDGPATVTFEILSPSTKDNDLNKKLPKYLDSGVKEIWIINPMEKKVKIYWKNKNYTSHKEEEWLKSRFIPGFRLREKWLWSVKSISPLEKFNEMKEG